MVINYKFILVYFGKVDFIKYSFVFNLFLRRI